MKTLALYLTLVIPFFAHAEIFTGKVVGIADGDTVTLLDSANTQYKIRLSGKAHLKHGLYALVSYGLSTGR